MTIASGDQGIVIPSANGPVFVAKGAAAWPTVCPATATGGVMMEEGMYTIRFKARALPMLSESETASLKYRFRYAAQSGAEKLWVKESKKTGGVWDYQNTWIDKGSYSLFFWYRMSEWGSWYYGGNGSTDYLLGEDYNASTTVHYYWPEVVSVMPIDNASWIPGTLAYVMPRLQTIYGLKPGVSSFDAYAEIYHHGSDPTTIPSDPDDNATLIMSTAEDVDLFWSDEWNSTPSINGEPPDLRYFCF